MVSMGPLSSIGLPSASTTRPISASPTGTDMMRPVRRTSSPSLNCGVVAEEHGADLIFFEVQRDAGNVVRKLDEFAGHDRFEAVDTGDTVADRDHEPGLRDVDGALVIFNLFAENSRDFVCSNLSHIPLVLLECLLGNQPLTQCFQLRADRTVING